jgi:hypothetical protein
MHITFVCIIVRYGLLHTHHISQSKHYGFVGAVFEWASRIILWSDQSICVEYDISESTRDAGMRLSFFFCNKGGIFQNVVVRIERSGRLKWQTHTHLLFINTVNVSTDAKKDVATCAVFLLCTHCTTLMLVLLNSLPFLTKNDIYLIELTCFRLVPGNT